MAYEAVLTQSSDTQHADQFLIDAVECFTDCWLPSFSRPKDFVEWATGLDKELLAVNKTLAYIPATDLEEKFPFLKIDELIDEVLERYGDEIVLEQFKKNSHLRKALRSMGLVSILEAMRESIAVSMSKQRPPLWMDELGYETPRQLKGARERLFVRRLKTLMRTSFVDMPVSAIHHSVARIANTLFDTDLFSDENVRKIF